MKEPAAGKPRWVRIMVWIASLTVTAAAAILASSHDAAAGPSASKLRPATAAVDAPQETPAGTQAPSATSSRNALTKFTASELARYDGTDPSLPIYLGLNGYVYDVTAGKSFYEPGGGYHFLVGRDASVELNQIGGDIIVRKYPAVGILTP